MTTSNNNIQPFQGNQELQIAWNSTKSELQRLQILLIAVHEYVETLDTVPQTIWRFDAFLDALFALKGPIKWTQAEVFWLHTQITGDLHFANNQTQRWKDCCETYTKTRMEETHPGTHDVVITSATKPAFLSIEDTPTEDRENEISNRRTLANTLNVFYQYFQRKRFSAHMVTVPTNDSTSATVQVSSNETTHQNHADSDEEDHALYKDYYYMNAAFDEQVNSPHDVKCMRALFNVLVSEETTTLPKMEEKHPDLVFRWAVPALNRHPLFKLNEPHELNTDDIKVELNGYYMQSLHRAYQLGFERGSRPPKKQRT